jgi:hypothetical protein
MGFMLDIVVEQPARIDDAYLAMRHTRDDFSFHEFSSWLD